MKILDLYEKSAWEDGPWKDEPDYMAWIDADTSYPCVMKRNVMGAWVGFVGIDEKHPLYMVPIHDRQFDYIEAHVGPCTYASFNHEESLQFSPPKKIWWIGFDCMHEDDYCPHMGDSKPRKKKRTIDDGSYRDYDYVKNEVEGLAMQIGTRDDRLYIGDFDSDTV